MIYIISSKKAAALGLADSADWFKLIPEFPAGFKAGAEDQVYIDISGLSAAEIKKSLAAAKKRCSLWGVIDPKGIAVDPAAFFFDGACDYAGPGLIKNGLSKKRFSGALAWAQSLAAAAGTQKKESDEQQARKNVKLPGGKFAGWNSIGTDAPESFFFLFASVSEKSNLHTKIGESNFIAARNRFRDTVQQNLREADALLWMEADDNCLFLIPPRAANGKAAVEAALKLQMNSRLITCEKIGLSFPVDFTFAMHFGKTIFRSPGKTGSVISESVNYIFHLGARKAETGRLTISADIPEEAIPRGLSDIFLPAGIYEGIPVLHSKRFISKN